jgi:hypothetical protein
VAAARTPFCKVCHDAGKPKSAYTSHFVKDSPGPNGKVVCPFLLSLNCRYCHESGHTVSHCQKLKDKNARVAVVATQAPRTPVQPPRHKCNGSSCRAPKKPSGFAVLANLSAEEDPNADRPAEEGPRRVLFKARGAWAAGAPTAREPVPVATPGQLAPAPLPAIEELDDSWMASATDEWGSGDLDMGAQATRVCPQ